MSQLRQFEGPDIRALLDEVSSIYGAQPAIARAETFRTGGVLGFFQREHYRLVVDEDAPRSEGDSGPQEHPADEILARAAYTAVAGSSRGSQPATATISTAGEGTASPAGLRRGVAWAGAPADPFAALADETIDSYEALPAGVPAEASDLTADTPFEAVLQRVASLVDRPEPEPVIWPRPSEPGPATPAAVAQPAPPPAATRTAAGERSALNRALRRVGFDDATARIIDETAAGRSLEAVLLERFESLPAAPLMPRRNGSLIVVTGPGRRAAAEAARIAGEVGTDPATVAFASRKLEFDHVPEELVLRRAEDAMELAPGHRRGRVGVVAVDAPIYASTAWASRVIEALRPTLVVGVVNALYKNEDLEAWLDDIGGVDVLVVDNPDATVSPASVLSLPVPVGRLGPDPAAPLRWTTLVMDAVHVALDADETAEDPRIQR